MVRSAATSNSADAPAPHSKWLHWILLACTAALGACALLLVCSTIRWPFVGDATLVRYGNLMMHAGFAPYRDLIDPNFPGAFLLDKVVSHTFGEGALAWRLFDDALLGFISLGMFLIAGRRQWFGALFAGVFCFLIHGRDGVDQTGQRDLVMAAALLAAGAAMLMALRHPRDDRRHSGAMFVFGLFSGAAATMKPTASLLWGAWMAMAVLHQLHRGRRALPILISSVAGFLVPVAVCGAWLLRWHAISAFLSMTAGLLPLHAGLDRLPLPSLLVHAIPSYLWPVLAFGLAALVIAGRRNGWRKWEMEDLTLVAGASFGLLSFLLQGKGFPYHRAPLLVFLLPLAGVGMARMAMHSKPAARATALAGLAYGSLVLAPVCTVRAMHLDWRDQRLIESIDRDLAGVGTGTSLSGEVQCMDTTAGCISALLRSHILQPTGMIYDCYLFEAGTSRYARGLQTRFLERWRQNPPLLFVVSNQDCFKSVPSYAKLERWPAFASLLQERYELVEDRAPAAGALLRWWSQPRQPFGYRIYQRRKRDATDSPPKIVPEAPMMCLPKLLVPALALLLTSSFHPANAQIGLYVDLSAARLDTPGTSEWTFGPTFGLYADRGRLLFFSTGLDFRGSILNSSNDAKLYSGLAGPRLAIRPHVLPASPYIEAVGGVGHAEFPNGAQSSATKFEYQFLGGADWTIAPRLDWRVVEFSYGGLSGFNGSFHPKTLSTGLVLRLPRL